MRSSPKPTRISRDLMARAYSVSAARNAPRHSGARERMENTLIRFDMGDWSWDGHAKVCTIIAETNADSDAIAAAYRKAVIETGFRFDSLVCGEYEDMAIKPPHLEFLRGLGYVPAVGFDPQAVTADDIFDMFIVMVRRGDPGITLRVYEMETFFRPGAAAGDLRNFNLGYGVMGV